MESLEKNIINRIDKMKDEIIKFHQESVKIPSENPPSNYKEIVRFTENKMKGIGLKTYVKRKNIIGEWGNDDGKTLIFNAHYDTVQAFKGWTKDPFGAELIDGKIYGRGSSDDKSCVTAEIFATKALIEAGIKLKGKLIVSVVCDEELGGLKGAEYLLRKGLINGDACLLGDAPAEYPFGYTGGTMYITIIIHGKQGHGLGAPDLPKPYRNEFSGINTINRIVKIMNFLLTLNEEFMTKETKYSLPEGFTLKVSHINLAEIHGGNKITTIPDKCYLHCSVNTIPEQDIASVKKQILDYVEDLKKQDPDLNINVQIPISIEPFVIDGQSDFANAVQKAFDTIYNEKREFKLVMPSTDAHWFQERGIETILIGTGRVESNVHNADEFVYIEDLINTTKIYALTALNYLK
ncbi:MAG: M20 family metallopeptidase [Candidatus Odinarchaeota archaeon]